MKRFLTVALILAVIGISGAYAQEKPFYVYADKDAPGNHYIPSGWMGDYGDMKFNDACTEDVSSGSTAIKIVYTARRSQGNGWAGIYWQSSANNWGTRQSGYDLTGFNKLVFMAKGKAGGEVITKMKVGGITANAQGEPYPYPDTVDVEYGPLKVTNQWEEYSINLVGKDLSYVNGGLCLIFNADQAQKEQTVYIDDVRFAYDPELKSAGEKTAFPFYVYADASSLDNHFAPSGWMPATAARDLKVELNSKDTPLSGDSCMKFEYKNNSGTRWAGIYWQNPPNNWGTIPNAGFDLRGATKLTFWARGEKGGEVVNEFKVGGIASGEFIDSDSASVGPLQLSKDWKKYEIDLRGKDLSFIIGGFAWATNIDVNDPNGIVFYVDEVKFEK